MVILLVPVFVEIAVEMDLDLLLGARDQPAGTSGKPVVGQLDLPAVFDLLAEDAVFIKYGVACRGVAVGSETVEIAGGKPSEAAVSETTLSVRPRLKRLVFRERPIRNSIEM